MTDTEAKLHDAEVQLDLAANHSDDDALVRSRVNAMISMARSVTFVMQKESAHPDLLQWYEQRMADMLASPNGPLLRFFNDNRVHTIHKGVVAPEKVTAKVIDLKMNGVRLGSDPTMIFWRFTDAGKYFPGGSGGVVRLCMEYLGILRALVSDWLRKRAEIGIT